MNEILHAVSFVSAGAANALFSAVWEGAALALGVWLCLRLLPGLSAAARSVVWLNVFVLLVLLHFVPAFALSAGDLRGGQASGVHLDVRWSLGVVAVWLALSLWRAAQLFSGIVQLRRLARRAIPLGVDPELYALLKDVPGARVARLCTSDEVARPSVLGFFRPRILLPSALAEHLTPQELHQVVLHEMEHLRRGDDWTNLLQKIGLVLFPLNPVLLWVERRLCTERELACDDRVMRSSAGRKAYAMCLARLAEFSLLRRSFGLVLGLWERRPELVKRVQRIVSQPVRSMGRRPAMAVTGSVLAGALACAIGLSRSPQLVSFLPVQQRALAASSLDPHEVARALGGTPQMVKAAVDTRTVAPGPRKTAMHQPMHRAALKAVQHSRPLRSQLASVNIPGLKGETWGTQVGQDSSWASLPAPEQQRAVIVFTEVTTFQAPPRVVLAVSPDRRLARPVLVPAYAIVHTPNGWLIIQI